MKNFLKKIIIRQNFTPSLIGVFVNPFFIARYGLYKGIKDNSHWLSGVLLDVGCGSKPYENLFNVTSYTGLEYNTEHSRKFSKADVFYNGGQFPFQDAKFDSVLCNQVLEHVFNPDLFLSEINRALKPGGKVLLTIPFVWDEHEQPYDYARYSSFGLKHLFIQHGFTVLKVDKINANMSVLFQLLNAYIFKVLPKVTVIQVIVCLIVMTPITLFGLLFGWIFPKNEDLFLDQIILAEKK